MQTGSECPERDDISIARTLGAQQRALVARILPANVPGNLDGLFAYHVLGDIPELPLVWNVNCATADWLQENAARLGYFPVLGSLGYALYHFGMAAPRATWEAFADGVNRLRPRELFPQDQISVALQPVAFLGLALGSKALGDNGADHRAWLLSVLDHPRLARATAFHRLHHSYVRNQLSGAAAVVDDVRHFSYPDEQALLLWSIARGAVQLSDLRIDLSGLQAQALRIMVRAEVESLDAPRAALMWAAIHGSLLRSTAELVLSRTHVSAVLRRFQDAMRRWRWDDPQRVKHAIRWPVAAEREVQDILWLVLRSVFDDVVDEETLPKLGHTSYRADFGIPSLRLLVEVKYARQAQDFKSIEQEVVLDSVAYLANTNGRYDRLIVFIYDDSSSVQEHGTTINMLRRLPVIEDVIIVSRPSQLLSSQRGISA